MCLVQFSTCQQTPRHQLLCHIPLAQLAISVPLPQLYTHAQKTPLSLHSFTSDSLSFSAAILWVIIVLCVFVVVSGEAKWGQYLDFKLTWLRAIYTRNAVILDIKIWEIFTPIKLLNNQMLNMWPQGLVLLLAQLSVSRPKSMSLSSNLLKNKNSLSTSVKWLLESLGTKRIWGRFLPLTRTL